MRLEMFLSMNRKAWISRLIARVTGGEGSHVGLLFTLTAKEWEDVICRGWVKPWVATDVAAWPDGLYRVYFESLLKVDKWTGKTGMRGPLDWRRLVEWRKMDPWRREVDLQPIPNLSEAQMSAVFLRCAQAVGKITYPNAQIRQNWLGARLRIAPRPGRRSEAEWTCSEMVVQVLFGAAPGWARRWLRVGTLWLCDEYAPSSSGRRHVPGVWEMIATARRSPAEALTE